MDTPGLFLLAMLCGMAGAALLGFFASRRGMAQAGIRPGSMTQGVGVASGVVLTGLGLVLIVTKLL